MISVPVAAGAGAFAALVSSEVPAGGVESFLMLLLPAALIGMLLVAFGLLPLWCLLARSGPNARTRLMLIAALLWLVSCGALIAAMGLAAESTMHEAMAILIPGLVLISIFGLLADQRGLPSSPPMGNDGRQALSALGGQGASRPGPVPAEAPFPGSATAGD
jgi:hypothetical protein